MSPPLSADSSAPALGIGLLPAISRRAATDPPVAWLHLDASGARRTLRLVWRRDTYLSAAAQTFRDKATERLKAPDP